MEKMEKNMDELMKNPEFLKKMEQAETPEEVSTLLQSYGVQVTPEEVKAIIAQPEGELDVNDLDNVSGGSAVGIGVLAGVRVLRWMIKHPKVWAPHIW